jgi:hypothetical protein
MSARTNPRGSPVPAAPRTRRSSSSVLVPVSPQQAFLALRLPSCLSLSLHQLLSKPRPKTELARAAHMNLTASVTCVLSRLANEQYL